MNLINLSDEKLLIETEKAAAGEREATTRLLHHLGEVQRRRLFAVAGCASLFDYCVRVLKMSEPQAARRVNAARVLVEFPELEEKINSGVLSVTAVSQAQVFFRAEAKAAGAVAKEKKREILAKIEGCSTRKIEKVLAGESTVPQAHIREIVKEVGSDFVEVRCALDQDTLAAIERLKEVWSHEMPGATVADIIKKMAKVCAEKFDPQVKAERAVRQREARKAVAPAPESRRSRYIPAAVRQEVRLRDRGACTFMDNVGRQCGSRQFLQFDHVAPFGKGGENSAENLRLRCFAHNQLHLREQFGQRR